MAFLVFSGSSLSGDAPDLARSATAEVCKASAVEETPVSRSRFD
jgi:hypothetical protein